MTDTTLSRRHFHHHRAHRRRRLCARRRHRRSRRGGEPERAALGRGSETLSRRDQRLGRDRARRHRDHPLWPRRDGAGQLHRPAADSHRGARMRLGLRQAGIRFGQPQSAGEQGLRQPRDRRQPRGARDRRDGPAGRRERARTPDRRGREALERARVRMRGRHEQGHAQAERPHLPVRRAGGRGGRDQARQGAGAQAAGSVQVHRPAARAAGRAAQDQRLGQIRHRSGSARHGAGRDHQDARCSAAP